MSGKSADELKQLARSLPINKKSRYAFLQKLILDGFLDRPVTTESIIKRIREVFSQRWPSGYVQTHMKKFIDAGIVQAVKIDGIKGNHWVLASLK